MQTYLRRNLAISFFLLCTATSCVAATRFSPQMKDVCTKSHRNPNLLLLDRKKLAAQLVEKQAGLSPIDLDASGDGITFDREASAIVNPEGFCRSSTCAKDVQKKLQNAQIQLIDFIITHSQEPDLATGGIDTGGIEPTQQGLSRFFRGESVAPIGICVPPSSGQGLAGANPPSSGVGSGTAWPALSPMGTADNSTGIPQHISLRQSVDDLKYSQADKEFAGLKQANLAFTDDTVAKKVSYTIDAALGYVIGRYSRDPDGHYIGQAIPFVTYDQKYVETTNVKNNVRIKNFSTGLVGDLTFKTGDWYNNISVYPKFTN
jgi:hypothetical protein